MAAIGFTMVATTSALGAQDDPQWNRMYSVRAGAELRVDTQTTARQICRFLDVDERGLTVANTKDLPRAAQRIVADLARDHPDRLLNSGILYAEDNVRIDRDGLWVGSRRVVDRPHLVERIDKIQVREIRYAGPGGTNGKRGALIGLASGAAAAYFYSGVWSCGQGAVVSECHGYGLLTMPVGAAAGAAIGYLAGEHTLREPSDIIYSRP
jgi:hypothetical protein